MPVVSSLHEELKALAVRARAHDVVVIDGDSPVVWGCASISAKPARAQRDAPPRRLDSRALLARRAVRSQWRAPRRGRLRRLGPAPGRHGADGKPAHGPAARGVRAVAHEPRPFPRRGRRARPRRRRARRARRAGDHASGDRADSQPSRSSICCTRAATCGTCRARARRTSSSRSPRSTCSAWSSTASSTSCAPSEPPRSRSLASSVSSSRCLRSTRIRSRWARSLRCAVPASGDDLVSAGHVPPIFVSHGTPSLAVDAERGRELAQWGRDIGKPRAVLVDQRPLEGAVAVPGLHGGAPAAPPRLRGSRGARAPRLAAARHVRGARRARPRLRPALAAARRARGRPRLGPRRVGAARAPLPRGRRARAPAVARPRRAAACALRDRPQDSGSSLRAACSCSAAAASRTGSPSSIRAPMRRRPNGRVSSTAGSPTASPTPSSRTSSSGARRARTPGSAHPTPEHLEPLFVIAGAASLYDHAVGFPVRGFEHGTLSRRCVQFGR